MTDDKHNRGVFEEFSEETTLHGIPHFLNGNIIRRILWISLTIACTALMIVQITLKVIDFKKHPIVTNIEMEYPNELTFPAVLVCNTIQYKLTSVKDDLFTMITDIYKRDKPVVRGNLSKYDTEFAKVPSDIQDFMKEVAPKIEDMLISCQWPNGTECSDRDFVPIRTDYGVCYGINTDKQKPMKVNSAGVSSSLSMLFNVESYETTGPMNTMGLKLMAYNQVDLPLVRLHGMDISTGFLTQVGLTTSKTQKVHKDSGGTCVTEDDLQYFDGKNEYSIEKCKFDKQLKNIISKCGCKPANAEAATAQKEGQYCTVKQHFNCILEAQQETVADEDCDENCTTVHFKSKLSFSRLPTYSLKTKIGKSQNELQRRFLNATETRERIQQELAEATQKVIDGMIESQKVLKKENMEPLIQKFHGIQQTLKEKVPCYATIQKNYEELVEVYKVIKTIGTYALPNELEKLQVIKENMPDIEIVKRFQLLHESQKTKLETMDNNMALIKSNIKETIKTVLLDMVNPENYVTELENTIDSYQVLFDSIYQYIKGNISKVQWAENSLQFSSTYPQLFEQVTTNLNKNIQTVVDYYKKLDETKNKLQEVIQIMTNHSDPYITKLISSLFNPHKSARNQTCMKNLLKQVQDAGVTLTGSGMPIELCCLETTDDRGFMMHDIRSLCPFETNVDYSQMIVSTVQCLDGKKMRNQVNNLNSIGDRIYKTIADPFDKLLEHLKDYQRMALQSNEMLYQNNILAVNIYFEEMRIEKIEQQKAYGFVSLTCDIGGTMGLYIGASLMTFYEIIDYFILKPLLALKRKKNNSIDEHKESEVPNDIVVVPRPT